MNTLKIIKGLNTQTSLPKRTSIKVKQKHSNTYPFKKERLIALIRQNKIDELVLSQCEHYLIHTARRVRYKTPDWKFIDQLFVIMENKERRESIVISALNNLYGHKNVSTMKPLVERNVVVIRFILLLTSQLRYNHDIQYRALSSIIHGITRNTFGRHKALSYTKELVQLRDILTRAIETYVRKILGRVKSHKLALSLLETMNRACCNAPSGLIYLGGEWDRLEMEISSTLISEFSLLTHDQKYRLVRVLCRKFTYFSEGSFSMRCLCEDFSAFYLVAFQAELEKVSGNNSLKDLRILSKLIEVPSSQIISLKNYFISSTNTKTREDILEIVQAYPPAFSDFKVIIETELLTEYFNIESRYTRALKATYRVYQ